MNGQFVNFQNSKFIGNWDLRAGQLNSMNRLKQKYQDEIRKTLKEEFGVTNLLAVPRVDKVVINMGVGEAKDNEGILEKAQINILALAGHKPVVTRAK
jgi:large subunit ribosomal protein L5